MLPDPKRGHAMTGIASLTAHPTMHNVLSEVGAEWSDIIPIMHQNVVV